MPSLSLEEEFRRNPEFKEEDLKYLQEWNSKQSHLPTVPDDLLFKFLHKSRYSLEKAKRTMETCFTVRTHTPELFDCMDPEQPEVQTVWQYMKAGYLSKSHLDGSKILLIQFITEDTSLVIHRDFIKWLDMTIGILAADQSIPGIHAVFDCKCVSLGYLTRFNPTLSRKYLTYMQDGMCLRMLSVNFINHGIVVDKLVSLMMPMMKQKLAKKFQFHTTLEDLYKVIPKELMPSDYGGPEASMDVLCCDLKKKMNSMRSWFQENQKLKTDESKRQGPPLNIDNLFGAEGSFRKLRID